MEYMQMTLNDWLEMKQSLERELSNLKTGFIRVGYCLRRIEETRGYEQDGYKSVAEFAKKEYGLSASTVSRFMAINERFSLNGYSERLDPKYMGFHQSIMGEMLGLPDQDLELVTPETSRQDVRELKQFNRQEPERGIADDLKGLIESYFQENRQELNEIYDGRGTPAQEILNPSGNKVYRKGMFMMFFYTDNVKVKKFGGETSSYSWEEFRELIDSIFAASAGPETYENYFGIHEKVVTQEPEKAVESAEEKKPEVGKDEPAEGVKTEAESPAGHEEPEKKENMPQEDAGHETDDDSSAVEDEPAEGDVQIEEADPDEGPETAAEVKPDREADHFNQETEHFDQEAVHSEVADHVEKAEAGTDDALPAEGVTSVAPAQKTTGCETVLTDIPDRYVQEYQKAMEDTRKKLEEIQESLESQDWNRMSEQILSLGIIVNQLKVMKTITR